jgi:ribonuclease HII
MIAAPLVCGVDEAGRGPLAGAVVAACVVLDPRRPIPGLADSKQLSPARRIELAQQIRRDALGWAIASASVEEIDALNILQASLLAMRRALDALSPELAPARVLVDGLHCPVYRVPCEAVVRGDASVPAISAASILAKVSRDAAMEALHGVHPEYDFAAHKGYPTPAHLAALRRHGPCPAHRRSFAPVRELLEVKT